MDFIKYPVFGHDPYPSLVEKAAYLLSFIIDRYPFADGNKRSATATAAYFLEKNGYILELHGREGAMLALDIGDSKITFDQVVAWVSRHIVPK